MPSSRVPANDPDDDWELSPDTAHPDAAGQLKGPYFWDLRDEHSPFGSDLGAATLAAYRAALATDDDLDEAGFLEEFLEARDVDRVFAEGIADEALGHRLEREHSHILAYDDIVVALAFAQIVLRGEASSQIAAAAIESLRRQALPEVLAFRGWSDAALRRRRCREMMTVLRPWT